MCVRPAEVIGGARTGTPAVSDGSAKARAERLRWLLSGGRRVRTARSRDPDHVNHQTRKCPLRTWVAVVFREGPTPTVIGIRATTPALCSCWKDRKKWLDAPRCESRPASGFRSPLSGPCRPPLQLPPVDSRWLTQTVLALCSSVARTGRSNAYGGLADALQEAGCNYDEVLEHCRDRAITHERGCWVADWLLGQEPTGA